MTHVKTGIIRTSKVKLTFAGRSGSNRSAFYLYIGQQLQGYAAPLTGAHVQASRDGIPLQ